MTLVGAARRLLINQPRRFMRDRVETRRARRMRERFYRTLIDPKDLVFDVGANIGNRVAVFVRLGATVVAIEPQSACLATLRRSFGRERSVVIEPVGLGAETGTSTLRLAEHHTIATMSDEFVNATQESGRFADYHWAASEVIEVVTLDHLIAKHGRPTFCKIDVEGYEPQVLAGLTVPIRALSFEYTAEMPQCVRACVGELDRIGSYEYNYSAGESMEWARSSWVGSSSLLQELGRGAAGVDWGDVYARLVTP